MVAQQLVSSKARSTSGDDGNRVLSQADVDGGIAEVYEESSQAWQQQ